MQNILDAVTELTAKVDALANAISVVSAPVVDFSPVLAAIAAIPASQPVDLSGIDAKLDAIAAAVADVRAVEAPAA